MSKATTTEILQRRASEWLPQQSAKNTFLARGCEETRASQPERLRAEEETLSLGWGLQYWSGVDLSGVAADSGHLGLPDRCHVDAVDSV